MKGNGDREETKDQIIRAILSSARTSDFVLSGMESHRKVLSRRMTNMIYFKRLTVTQEGDYRRKRLEAGKIVIRQV